MNMDAFVWKRIFLLFICCLSFLYGFTQGCVSQNDPITGEKTCMFSNRQSTMRYEYRGGDNIDLYLTFAYIGEQNIIMPKGSKIFIKLKNKVILSLLSIKDAVPQTRLEASAYSAAVYTLYTFAFKLNKHQLKSLAEIDIIFMRYPSIDGGTVDFDGKGPSKKYIRKIKEGAKCVHEGI